MNASKDGLHIRPAEKRVNNFVVYDLYDGENYLCSAYGGCSVMCLGLLAEHFASDAKAKPGTSWFLLEGFNDAERK